MDKQNFISSDGGADARDSGSSGQHGFSGDLHRTTITIKRERTDLDDILGPIVGEIFPLTSTPISDRSQTTTAGGGGMFVAEPSPIDRVMTHQVNLPISRTPRRALFQESNSAVQGSMTTPSRQATLPEMFSKRTPNNSQGTMTQGMTSATSSCNTTVSSSRVSTPTKTCQVSNKRGGKKRKSTDTTTAFAARCSKQRKKSTDRVEKSKRTRASLKQQKIASSRINDSGINGDISLSSEYSDASIDLVSDSEYCNEDDEVSIRSTVPHFSIHRLPVDQLHERFDDPSLSEINLIEQIMDEINEDIKRRYKNRKEFEQRTATLQTESETPSQQAFEKFGIVPYVQKVSHRIPILAKLGIVDECLEVNLIIFYYREQDIYAITTGSTWQTIQKYSCYDFPCQISGRLTATDGNMAESSKPIAGNSRTIRKIKKNATRLDNLRNIRLNVTKEVRNNSSLYHLKEFSSSEDSQSHSKRKIRILIGMAFVRFLSRIDLLNFPEILDLFSKIARGEDTLTFPDERIEKHIDETPPIRIVRGEEAQQVEKSFYELINLFMHNQRTDLIRKFDFVDKHIDDFCSAEEFKLIYNNGGEKYYDIASFTSCPTALEVLRAIKAQCGDDLANNKLTESQFSYRLKNYVKVQYRIKGRKECTRKRVVDLLEGEMTINSKDFWKTMGQWWLVRDHYYYEIYRAFGNLLNKPGVYEANEYLTKPWNKNTIKNVQDYAKLYEEEGNCFFPPSQGTLEEMSSQVGSYSGQQNEEEDEGIESDSRMLEESLFFDMMRVCKREDGQYEFWLFYIFNGFDAGIRDASTRIKKSMEMLLLDAPTHSTKSLLEKFWEYYMNKSGYFRCLFHDYEMFRQPLTRGNRVSIVVAFATGAKQMETSIIGPMSQYVTSTSTTEVNNFAATLDREKDLRLDFSLTNVYDILTRIRNAEPKYLDSMCRELEIVTDSGDYDMDLLATKVLGLLMTNEYCTQNDSLNSDKPVTGKLLKMRNYTDFKLFENANVNKKIFEVLSMFYITGFPGFIHKLECFQIVEAVAKEARLTLNFVEIK